MRKRLAAAAIAAVSATGILFAAAPAALADGCFSSPEGYNECTVQQNTAAGYAEADAFFYGSSGTSNGTFINASGYSMEAWVQINYGSGWIIVWQRAMPNGSDMASGYYDDNSSWTEACFQFTSWSGAAVHCTGEV